MQCALKLGKVPLNPWELVKCRMQIHFISNVLHKRIRSTCLTNNLDVHFNCVARPIVSQCLCHALRTMHLLFPSKRITGTEFSLRVAKEQVV